MTDDEVTKMRAREAADRIIKQQQEAQMAMGRETTAFAGLRSVGQPISNAALDNWFTHHPPTHDQVRKYEQLREAGRNFAVVIRALCPPGADTTTAIRTVREAVMTANAAIACGGGANV